MVAPLSIPKPARMFSRLTYTGEDKLSSPVCCDLSRVASVAAASPLPKHLEPERQEVRTNVTAAASQNLSVRKRKNPFDDEFKEFKVAKCEKASKKVRRANRSIASQLLEENESLTKENEALEKKLRTVREMLLNKEEHGVVDLAVLLEEIYNVLGVTPQ